MPEDGTRDTPNPHPRVSHLPIWDTSPPQHQVTSNDALPLAQLIAALAGGLQNLHLPIWDTPPHHQVTSNDALPLARSTLALAGGLQNLHLPIRDTTHDQVTSNAALSLVQQNLQRQDVHLIPRRQL